MFRYHCVICTMPFTSPVANLPKNRQFCSQQCKVIDTYPQVRAPQRDSDPFQFKYVNHNRNRVFEVYPLERAREFAPHTSRRRIRQQGAGSRVRLTSR